MEGGCNLCTEDLLLDDCDVAAEKVTVDRVATATAVAPSVALRRLRARLFELHSHMCAHCDDATALLPPPRLPPGARDWVKLFEDEDEKDCERDDDEFDETVAAWHRILLRLVRSSCRLRQSARRIVQQLTLVSSVAMGFDPQGAAFVPTCSPPPIARIEANRHARRRRSRRRQQHQCRGEGEEKGGRLESDASGRGAGGIAPRPAR